MAVVELFPHLVIETTMDKVRMHAHLVKMANIHGYAGIDVDESHIAITSDEISMILQFNDTSLVTIRKAIRDGDNWRETYNDVTPDQAKYDYYEDAEHAWLRVPLAEIKETGIGKSMSARSRVRGDFAYLEDDEAELFIKARKWAGLEPHIVRHTPRDKHSIRSYAAFKRDDGLPYA